MSRPGSVLGGTALLLLLLLGAALPARGAGEAQDLAVKLGWFWGRSHYVLEAIRREPAAATVAALKEQLDALLPAGVLAPEELTREQQARRLAAAQAVGSSNAARRELQAVATRLSQPPRLRAAAAVALAVLRHELAPAALAMSLADQEDRATQQLLIHELLAALPRIESQPNPTADDRQLFYGCRRVAALSACEESPIWQKIGLLGTELRRLEAAGEQVRAAQLVESTPLPSACQARFLVEMARLPGPDSGDRIWRAVLQRIEERLVRAQIQHEADPGAEAKTEVGQMLAMGLARLNDVRAVASAANLALLLGERELVPALQAAGERVPDAVLARLLQTAVARLKGEPPPAESYP